MYFVSYFPPMIPCFPWSKRVTLGYIRLSKVNSTFNVTSSRRFKRFWGLKKKNHKKSFYFDLFKFDTKLLQYVETRKCLEPIMDYIHVYNIRYLMGLSGKITIKIYHTCLRRSNTHCICLNEHVNG